MRKLILTIFLVLLFGSNIKSSDIFDLEPSQTLFKSRVAHLTIVDSFLISSDNNEISLFKFNEENEQFNYIFSLNTNTRPVSVELCNSVLIIKDELNKLTFLDVSNLPQMTILGEISFEDEFYDFILMGEDLYLSMYFEGVWKYNLTNFNQAAFVDSSMLGILVTDLYAENDTLFVLDEYNGVLRYDISGSGFGQFIDYLYLPKRASSLIKYDSLFITTLVNDYIYFLDFSDNIYNGIIDSMQLFEIPGKLLYSDSLLIAISPRDLYFYDRMTKEMKAYYQIDNSDAEGVIFKNSNKEYLLIPVDGGGIDLYHLNTDGLPWNGLSYSSGISDLCLTDSTLFISGYREPIKVISAKDTATSEVLYQVLDYINGSTKFDLHGDSLFVLAPEFNQLLFVLNANSRDSNYVISNYQYEGFARDIHYNKTKINNFNTLLLEGLNYIQVFLVRDSGAIYKKNVWSFISNILDVVVMDSTLIVATTKKEILFYRINNYFNLRFLKSISVTNEPTKLLAVDKNLFIFEDKKVFNYFVTDEYGPLIDRVYNLDYSVKDACYNRGYMFTVGTNGVAAYKLYENELIFEDNGGLPGDIITANDNLLVTTDNDGINTYKLNLSYTVPDDDESNTTNQFNNNDSSLVFDLDDENFDIDINSYPNPFNLTTNFSYSIPANDFVSLEIYNLLGQKIKTLVNEYKTTGSYTAQWDGHNEDGIEVSTGLYLFKFSTSQENVKGKIVLIK